MQLTSRVVGAGVAYLKDVYIKLSETNKRRVVLFGINHAHNQQYDSAFTENAPGYFPNWIGTLVEDAGNSAATAILIEGPPFPLEAVALTDFHALPGDDFKLQHTMKRVKPHFSEDGVARTSAWELCGIDLRYLCKIDNQTFIKGDKGIRHSLHENLNETEPWQPSPHTLQSFYSYLVGLSDSKTGYDAVVTRIKTNQSRAATREAVLEQAVRVCQGLFTGVPDEVKRTVVRHLMKEGYESAELSAENDFDDLDEWRKQLSQSQIEDYIGQGYIKVRTTDYESRPNAEYSVRYLVGEQLVNLCILGHILTPASQARNIIVAVGSAHVETVVRYFLSLDVKTLVGLSTQGSILNTEFSNHNYVTYELPKEVSLHNA